MIQQLASTDVYKQVQIACIAMVQLNVKKSTNISLGAFPGLDKRYPPHIWPTRFSTSSSGYGTQPENIEEKMSKYPYTKYKRLRLQYIQLLIHRAATDCT